jgi:hypothetical protein
MQAVDFLVPVWRAVEKEKHRVKFELIFWRYLNRLVRLTTL